MKTFTLEFDREKETIEIHLDKKGAEYLREKLDLFINKDLNDHIHLMTEDWGGNELTVEKQSDSLSTKLLHSMKIMYWSS